MPKFSCYAEGLSENPSVLENDTAEEAAVAYVNDCLDFDPTDPQTSFEVEVVRLEDGETTVVDVAIALSWEAVVVRG